MATSLLQSSTTAAFSTVTTPKQTSSPYKPTKITMFQNKDSSTHTLDSQAHMEQVLSVLKPPTSAIDHLISVDVPRSMAPALCIAACKSVGGETEQAVEAASAIHLLHIASLTDRNPNLPYGYELLARLSNTNTSNPSNPGNILRVIMEISRAMGPQGMLQGEYEEMQCEMGWMDRLCEKKVGGLYACAAACGAILGGATDEEVETLRIFGHYVGMMHGMMLDGRKNSVEEFKSLALNQLQGLQLEKSEVIHRFMNRTCSVLGL